MKIVNFVVDIWTSISVSRTVGGSLQVMSPEERLYTHRMGWTKLVLQTS